ncbi:DUF4397 domain-containing protein [Natranaeroarchaeum aerophilus]|uniref:DUF4397 domain-containing protein n=1 Tax=Natranaeroarchaeum aerophilus TaxID=2917711 RepID=A0AAE3FSQ7_9EURY|nr:DUF4397 domain-containing protein [Natranaeroarchaeum aerophilus]
MLAGTGAAALLSATGVSLADEHEDDEDNDLDEDDPMFAAVNTVHASPDAPEVDVYVNGARVLESVAFRDISDYLVLLEGEYQVQVVPVENNGVDDENDNGVGEDDNGVGEDEDDNGFSDNDEEDDDVGMDDEEDDDVGMDDDETDVDVDEEAVIDEQIDVAAGVATAAVVGEVDEGAEQELELLVLDVDIDDLNDDESRVRAVHASPDAPEVDIVADDDPLVEGLGFGDFETFDVEAGEYSLEVREAGEDESVADFDVTLDAGVAYSAFAVGYLEDEDDDNGIGDNDEDDDNGFGDNNDNDTGDDADTGFDLLLNIDALTPQAEIEEMPEEDDNGIEDEDDNGIGDEEDDNGIDDEEDDNGIGDEDDDNGIGDDDDDNGVGDDDDDNGVGDDDEDDDNGIFDDDEDDDGI